MLHYQKGLKEAYIHVMTEWQESVFNNIGHNKYWAANLIQKLTGEQGADGVSLREGIMFKPGNSASEAVNNHFKELENAMNTVDSAKADWI